MVIYKAACICNSCLAKAKLFQGSELPSYIVDSQASDSTIYIGCESESGVVAVFRVRNEVGIDARIPLGYKCEFESTIENFVI